MIKKIFSTLIVYLLKLLAGYIILIMTKDLLTYIIFLIYYKPQGIKYHYEPVIGWLGLVIPRKMNDKYAFNYYQNLMNTKFKDVKMIAINQQNSLRVTLMPLDPEILGDFFAKEVKYTIKNDPYSLPQKLGFFHQGGEKAMDKRAIFNQFFQNEKLKNSTPLIRKVVRKHFKKWRMKFWPENEKREFKTIELRDLFPNMFIDLVNTILFGELDFPEVEGEKMPKVNSELVEDVMMVVQAPYNFLTFNILHELGILPVTRKMVRRVRKCNEEVVKTIKKREKISKDKRGLNLLDLMLNYNDDVKDEEKKLTELEICQSVSLFQIAGTDTSNNVSEMTLRIISLNSQFIEKMEKEVKTIFSGGESKGDIYETYDQSEYLNNFIKEVLRMNPILGSSTPRLIVKNFKLGKYKVYKGTQIQIPFVGSQMAEKNFENPLKFNPDRFKKKVKRNTYLPFSSGRRDCIGKNLGEMIVKLIVSNFLKEFEMTAIEGEELIIVNRILTGVDSCKVKFRPREHNK